MEATAAVQKRRTPVGRAHRSAAKHSTRVNPFFSNEKPGRRSQSSTSCDFGEFISKSLARAKQNTGGSYSQGGGSEGSWIVEAKSQRDPFEEGRR